MDTNDVVDMLIEIKIILEKILNKLEDKTAQ